MFSHLESHPISFFFFNAPAPTEIYTLSLHDALPISRCRARVRSPPSGTRRARSRRTVATGERARPARSRNTPAARRSEEHTSELQSRLHLVCRLLLEKKK